MTKRKGSDFHHGDLKHALMQAAVELLDREGAQGVTIRAVARLTGVSHAAPVNHFSDRQALLTAVATQEFDRIWQRIRKRLASKSLRGSDRVECFANAMIDYGIAHPHRYELLWRHDLLDETNTDLASVMDRIYDTLCEELQTLDPKIEFDRDTIAVALWSMVHGYISLRATGVFSARRDIVTKQARRHAMLSLFRTLLQ